MSKSEGCQVVPRARNGLPLPECISPAFLYVCGSRILLVEVGVTNIAELKRLKVDSWVETV